jgi:hypothetical protein|tara:strand:- start:1025 stop:1171 length:147 start_codon:yes stop_codon:yes gene_type:complete
MIELRPMLECKIILENKIKNRIELALIENQLEISKKLFKEISRKEYKK